jgi:hypothetical protein
MKEAAPNTSIHPIKHIHIYTSLASLPPPPLFLMFLFFFTWTRVRRTWYYFHTAVVPFYYTHIFPPAHPDLLPVAGGSAATSRRLNNYISPPPTSSIRFQKPHSLESSRMDGRTDLKADGRFWIVLTCIIISTSSDVGTTNATITNSISINDISLFYWTTIPYYHY